MSDKSWFANAHRYEAWLTTFRVFAICEITIHVTVWKSDASSHVLQILDVSSTRVMYKRALQMYILIAFITMSVFITDVQVSCAVPYSINNFRSETWCRPTVHTIRGADTCAILVTSLVKRCSSSRNHCRCAEGPKKSHACWQEKPVLYRWERIFIRPVRVMIHFG